MKRIKLGYLIVSNSWGGAENSTWNILSNIDKEKFEVYLYVNDFLYEKYSELEGVEVVSLGKFESNRKVGKLRSIGKVRRKLQEKLRNNQIEVLHSRLENALLILSFGIHMFSVPKVFTLSGDETRIYMSPTTFEQRWIRYALKRLLSDANSQVTSVSSWLVKDLSTEEKVRITITPNGLDTKTFIPINGRAVRDNVVLYVGRLVEKKGIEDLVEVAKLSPDLEFWFVGDGPLKSLLRLPNTKALGFKSRDEVIDLYSQATVCTFPSYAEGMPMVGLEAMACGKPVVASYHGFSEYIEDGVDGVIIEPGNITQIQDAIRSICSNDEVRTTISTKARLKAKEYDISKTVLNYESIYSSLAPR